MKKTFALHNDFKRTAIDLGSSNIVYKLYQDLNNSKLVLIAEITTVGTVSTEKYYLQKVADTTASTTLWNNRASLVYKNLIDISIDDKLN